MPMIVAGAQQVCITARVHDPGYVAVHVACFRAAVLGTHTSIVASCAVPCFDARFCAIIAEMQQERRCKQCLCFASESCSVAYRFCR